ncbi:hypothetical protein ACOSQ3_010662 [Xanthoceras sorbifolium]
MPWWMVDASFVGDFVVEPSVMVGGLAHCKDIKWKPPNTGCFKLNTDAGWLFNVLALGL